MELLSIGALSRACSEVWRGRVASWLAGGFLPAQPPTGLSGSPSPPSSSCSSFQQPCPPPSRGGACRCSLTGFPPPQDWSLPGLESTPRGPGHPWEAPTLISSSISIYSYTFNGHLLLYESPCISPSLPTVHLPGQQQRKAWLTEGPHNNTHGDFNLVPPSAGSLLLTSSRSPNIETGPPLDLLFSLTHPRSQQSRSLSQAQDLVSPSHK